MHLSHLSPEKMCEHHPVKTWVLRTGLGLALVMATACGGLSERAKSIRFANKVEMKQCRFLKVVYGGKKGGFNPKNEALETAADLRATHVVALYEKGGKFTGDAFDCNQRPKVAQAKKPGASQPATQTPPASAGATQEPVPQPEPAPAPPPAQDAEEWVVAVMDVKTVTRGRGALDRDLMRNISDQLRIFVAQHGIKTVDRSAQDAAFKDHLAEMKADSYKGCYDDNCQIELGKALAASHILRSRITQFGKLCVLNGELIDLRAEVAIGAASSRGDCEEEGFLQMSEDIAKKLVAKR